MPVAGGGESPRGKGDRGGRGAYDGRHGFQAGEGAPSGRSGLHDRGHQIGDSGRGEYGGSRGESRIGRGVFDGGQWAGSSGQSGRLTLTIGLSLPAWTLIYLWWQHCLAIRLTLIVAYCKEICHYEERSMREICWYNDTKPPLPQTHKYKLTLTNSSAQCDANMLTLDTMI